MSLGHFYICICIRLIPKDFADFVVKSSKTARIEIFVFFKQVNNTVIWNSRVRNRSDRDPPHNISNAVADERGTEKEISGEG